VKTDTDPPALSVLLRSHEASSARARFEKLLLSGAQPPFTGPKISLMAPRELRVNRSMSGRRTTSGAAD
jgi:hypothetical protein